MELVQRAPAEGAKVLVFRGEGKTFSAGFDFSDVEQQTEGDLLLRFVRVELLLQAVASSPCLTVALAHGRTFGAGWTSWPHAGNASPPRTAVSACPGSSSGWCSERAASARSSAASGACAAGRGRDFRCGVRTAPGLPSRNRRAGGMAAGRGPRAGAGRGLA